MRTLLTAEDADRLLATFADQFERTAFRLELQPTYAETGENESVSRFLAGDLHDPVAVSPSLRDWFAEIRKATAAGKVVQRVRIFEEPPTGVQRWERWLGGWNAAAGEDIRYLTQSRAHQIGLLPAAGDTDWWLFDDSRLLIYHFDAGGNRICNEVDDDPNLVEQARAWRDLAVRHGVPGHADATPA